MKNKRRTEMLLKVIKRFHQQHPDMCKIIDSSMVHVCREENISPDQPFFILLFFAAVFIIMGYSIKLLCAKETIYENSGSLKKWNF